MMVITVVGLGFVGLTTALGFAEKGFKVFGLEASKEKLGSLMKLKVPFFEPMLREKLQEHLGKNFILTDSVIKAVEHSDVIMICVGSPSDPNGKVNLSQIKGAIGSVLGASSDGKFRIICIKSSVPPATTGNDISAYIKEAGYSIGKDIGVANNPEFLREGYAWEDFIRPDRIVIGVSDQKSSELLQKIYAPFNVPVHTVSLNTGEFVKYLSNTLLATMISFANELSMIAHTIGDIDIEKSFHILHEDSRWKGVPANMTSYVYPGCGFGGYCLPKDTSALIGKAEDLGYKAQLLQDVLKVNEKIASFHVDRIVASVSVEQQIAILGLAFKPDSDDVRSSPSAEIINGLWEKGYRRIVAYDPIAIDSFKKMYAFDINYAPSLKEALNRSSAVVIATAWKEFQVNTNMFSGKAVFDLRYSLS